MSAQEFESVRQDSGGLCLEQISRRISECHSPDDFTALSLELFGNPMVIFDRHMRVLSCSQIATDDVRWNHLNQYRVPEPEVFDSEDWQKMIHSVWDPVPVILELRWGQQHMTKVLRTQASVVGRVDVTGLFHPLTQQDQALLELVSASITLILCGQNTASPAKLSEQELYLQCLLEGRQLSEDTLRQYEENFKLKNGEYFYLLCGNALSSPNRLDRDYFGKIIQPRDVVLHYDNHVLLLLSNRKQPNPEWLESMAEVLEMLNFRCGLSYPFRSLKDMHKCYQQACSALSIGTRVDIQRYLYVYEEYLIYDLFSAYATGEEMMRFLSPGMQALIAIDRRQNLELLKTLRCYLYHGRSVQKAAQELHVHRNTVNFRIGKAFDILGHEPGDGHYLMRLCTAILILEYINRTAFFGT